MKKFTQLGNLKVKTLSLFEPPPVESSAGNSNGGENWADFSDTDEGQNSYDGVMGTQQMSGQLPPMRPQQLGFNMGSFDHVNIAKYGMP
ncbi:hypothetical protein ABW21_db0203087 [Orbilia brochopaga]|nr:hypothetical protein ABW21_db0203087 [Drechslerella brochopaga]